MLSVFSCTYNISTCFTHFHKHTLAVGWRREAALLFSERNSCFCIYVLYCTCCTYSIIVTPSVFNLSRWNVGEHTGRMWPLWASRSIRSQSCSTEDFTQLWMTLWEGKAVYYSNSPTHWHPASFFLCVCVCCFVRLGNKREAFPNTHYVWGWAMVDRSYSEIVRSPRPTYAPVLYF